MDIWMFPFDGDRKPYPVIQEPANQSDGQLSPDGQWVAYTNRSQRGSSGDVRVYSLSTGVKRRVSTTLGGAQPRWRADGKELFYRAGDGTLMAVSWKVDATHVQPGIPEPLFQARGMNFGVSSDGRRFLITTVDDPDSVSSLVVLSNWRAALKR